MLLKIEGVWCKTRTEFDKLARSQKSDLVISFHEIQNRLVKSDPYSKDPSEVIVSLYIMKLLSKIVLDRCDEEQTHVLYMFKNLDKETACNLKEYISSLTTDPFEYNLTVINMAVFPKKGVLSTFDNVKFIEND
jgi:hypothetical protein